MLLDISLKQEKDMYCVESEIATVATFYKRRYEMAFLDAWKFDFLPPEQSPEGTLGGRIYTGFIEDWWMWGHLEEFHGIRVLWNEDYVGKDIMYVVKTELEQNRPISVMMDSFYLPWAHQYEKDTHYETLMMVVGMEENGIYCIDIHSLKRVVLLPLDAFLKGHKQYTVFLPMRDETKEINWRKLFGDRAKRLLGEGYSINSFDSMRALADCVRDTMDFALEIKGHHHPLNAGIIRNIETLGRGRFLFSSAIKYVDELYHINNFDKLYENFKTISNMWHLVKYQMIRHFYTGSPDKAACKMIGEKIEEASVMEEKMAHLILECTEKGIVADTVKIPSKTAPSEEKVKDFVFVELKDYLNNKGTGEMTETYNFNTLDFEEMKAAGPDKLHFSLPCILEETYDNISCTGQTIKIPSGKYKSIMLVGCSFWGSFSEKMSVTYSDGEKKEFYIGFTCFDSGVPLFGESVFYSGNLIEVRKDIVRRGENKGHLFLREHALDANKEVTEIQLPNYPNILIYGISMGK